MPPLQVDPVLVIVSVPVPLIAPPERMSAPTDWSSLTLNVPEETVAVLEGPGIVRSDHFNASDQSPVPDHVVTWAEAGTPVNARLRKK